MLLRHDFTLKLSFKVLMGGFVNLVGPHGQGRRRTLSDLFAVLPSSMPIIFHDLKQGEDALDAMLERFTKHHGQALFVLHNANLLQNRDMLDMLIAESEKPHKSFLTVSESGDDLAAEPVAELVIPTLTAEDINSELLRRGVAQAEITEELLNSIVNAADPYRAMAEVARAPELQGPKNSLIG